MPRKKVELCPLMLTSEDMSVIARVIAALEQLEDRGMETSGELEITNDGIVIGVMKPFEGMWSYWHAANFVDRKEEDDGTED